MFVRLPVDVADPVEQLRRVRLDTLDAKVVHGAIGADMIGDVTELTRRRSSTWRVACTAEPAWPNDCRRSTTW